MSDYASLTRKVRAVLELFKDNDHEAGEMILSIIAKHNGRKGGRPPGGGGGAPETRFKPGYNQVIGDPNIDLILTPDPDQISDTQENQVSTSPQYSAAFLAFWAKYPRKTGKGEAWSSWRRKIAAGDAPAIMRALEWQTRSHDWTKNGGQYVPMPATYLNQRRWEDEPPRGSQPANSNGISYATRSAK